MFTIAIFTALGIYVIFLRLGIYRVLRWGSAVDIAVSAGLVFVLAGSFIGVATASIAGVLVSVLLALTKLLLPKPKPKPTLWAKARARVRARA